MTSAQRTRRALSRFSYAQLLIAAAYCVVQGCTVRVPEGKYRCDERTLCPGNTECRSGFCYNKTSSSHDGIVEDMNPDAGPHVSDTGPASAGAAAMDGDGGGGGSGEGGSSGGAGGSHSAGVSGASQAGKGGGGTGPQHSPECVLGEATLGACVLP